MENATIKISECGNFFGNMLLECTSGISTLFNKCIELLYNYNRSLYRASLPREIMAIRFFQETDKDGLNLKVPAKIMYDSKQYVELEFSKYTEDLLHFTDGRYGRIGITPKDRMLNEDESSMSVTIDMKRKLICFKDIGNLYNLKEYKSLFGKDASDLLSFNDAISYDNDISYDGGYFFVESFNMLDEFYEFLLKNKDGFKIQDGLIFVPEN